MEEQFNESTYLNAQEKLLQYGIENKVDELKIRQGSHDLFDNIFFECTNHYRKWYYKIQGQINNVLKECGGIEIKIWNA